MTTYSTICRLPLMVPGDPAVKSAWGTIINAGLPLTEQLSSGVVSIDLTGVAAHSLSVANNAPDEARMAFLLFSGASSGAATITIPAIARIGWVANTSTHTLILTTGSGTTLTVPLATSYLYRCDGTNVTAVQIGLPGAVNLLSNITLPNNVAYRGTDVGGIARNLVLLDSSNNVVHANGGGGNWVVQNQAATQSLLTISNAGASIFLGTVTAPVHVSSGATTVGTSLSVGTSASIGTSLSVSGSTTLAAVTVNGTAAHGANSVTGSNFAITGGSMANVTITGGSITNTPISGSTVAGSTGTFNALTAGAGTFTNGVSVGTTLSVGTTATIATLNSSTSSLGIATATQMTAAFIQANAVSFGAKDTGGTARGLFQMDNLNNATFLTGQSGTWRVVDNSFANQLFSIDNVGNAVHKGTLSAAGTTIGGTGLAVTGFTATSATGWSLNPSGTGAFSSGLNVGINSANPILATVFVAASDGRIKTDMRRITPAEGERFIREVPGRVYKKQGAWEAGFVAQDINAAGFPEILVQSVDVGMPAEQNGYSGPAGRRWEVVQGAPQAYLAAAVASLFEQVTELRAELAALRSAG